MVHIKDIVMKAKEKEFLILRTEGLSFDKIASKLKVSKPTLVRWSKIYQDEIQDLKAMDLLVLKEKYQYTQKKTYETLLKQIKKVEDAITNTDFSKLNIKDLMLTKANILEKIEQIESNTYFINVGLDEVGILDDLSMTKKQLVNIEETII
jgi:ABC-type antimicrobial peptide transport system permease subunit